MIKKANTAVPCLDLVNYFLRLKPASFKHYLQRFITEYRVYYHNVYSHDVSKTGEQPHH